MGDSPTGQVPAQPGANPPKPLFGGCWSCRLLTGTGLMLSAGYVFSGARNTMKRGGPTTIGTVFQIVFAADVDVDVRWFPTDDPAADTWAPEEVRQAAMPSRM